MASAMADDDAGAAPHMVPFHFRSASWPLFRDPVLLNPYRRRRSRRVCSLYPCALFVFSGDPAWRALRREAADNRAAETEPSLAGSTSASFGVMSHLASWFALHVIFRDEYRCPAFACRSMRPCPSLDPGALVTSGGRRDRQSPSNFKAAIQTLRRCLRRGSHSTLPDDPCHGMSRFKTCRQLDVEAGCAPGFGAGTSVLLPS